MVWTISPTSFPAQLISERITLQHEVEFLPNPPHALEKNSLPSLHANPAQSSLLSLLEPAPPTSFSPFPYIRTRTPPPTPRFPRCESSPEYTTDPFIAYLNMRLCLTLRIWGGYISVEAFLFWSLIQLIPIWDHFPIPLLAVSHSMHRFPFLFLFPLIWRCFPFSRLPHLLPPNAFCLSCHWSSANWMIRLWMGCCGGQRLTMGSAVWAK